MDATGAAFDTRQGRPEAGPFPPAARVAAVLIGIVLGVWFSSIAAGMYAEGFILTGVALPLVTLPFALFLVLVGLVPSVMQRRLTRWSRVDLRDGGHVFALIVVTLALFVIFGLGSLVDGLYAFENVILERGNGNGAFADVTEPAILTGLAVNLVLFGAPALVWLTFVRDHSLAGAIRGLGFRSERLGTALLTGAGFAVATIFAIALITALVTAAGVPVPENEQAVNVAKGVSVVGAFLVAALSSLSEEVFFRGFLMPRVGLLAQAGLFAIAHLSYVNVLQVVVTLLLGLGFGWLYRRTNTLWAPIAAHFTFNLIMLLLPRIAGYGDAV